MSWYRKSANQGNGAAQYSLGIKYRNGTCVPQDYVLAHAWLNLAASHESILQAAAVEFREKVAAKMTQAQIAEAQKLAQEWTPK